MNPAVAVWAQLYHEVITLADTPSAASEDMMNMSDAMLAAQLAESFLLTLFVMLHRYISLSS